MFIGGTQVNTAGMRRNRVGTDNLCEVHWVADKGIQSDSIQESSRCRRAKILQAAGKRNGNLRYGIHTFNLSVGNGRESRSKRSFLIGLELDSIVITVHAISMKSFAKNQRTRCQTLSVLHLHP